MLIIQKLEQLFVRFGDGDARSQVAEYLIDAAPTYDNESLTSVAGATGVSKPSVVRTVQTIGFEGWTDFNRAFSAECLLRRERETGINHSIPFTRGDSLGTVAHNLAQIEAEAVKETQASLDMNEFARAVDWLRNARRILLLGWVNQRMLLETFAYKLIKIGKIVEQPPADYGRCYFGATGVGEGDCAIVVSYSGETGDRPPMSEVPALRAAGAKVVALTGEGDNYLRSHADAVLTILSYERLYKKLAEFSTEASTKYLLDTLYAGVFLGDYDGNLNIRLDRRRSGDDCRGDESHG